MWKKMKRSEIGIASILYYENDTANSLLRLYETYFVLYFFVGIFIVEMVKYERT